MSYIYDAELQSKVALSRSVAVATSSTQLAGPNPLRRALIFSPTSLNTCWISFGQPAVVGQGLALMPGTQAPPLVYPTLGASLVQDVFAIFDSVGETLGFIEVMA